MSLSTHVEPDTYMFPSSSPSVPPTVAPRSPVTVFTQLAVPVSVSSLTANGIVSSSDGFGITKSDPVPGMVRLPMKEPVTARCFRSGNLCKSPK